MFRLILAGLAAAATLGALPAQADPDPVLAREVLSELVATNTAPSGKPDLRPVVDLLAARLRAAGFPEEDIHLVGPDPALPNLVVRYRSPDPQAAPVLMMAHLDVVEALASDWSFPPYALTEDEGWLYGRGSTDNKAGAAILVANFIALRRSGFVPSRDLIVMLTADEETTGEGADYLATQRRDLIEADFALNTDGGFVMLGHDGPRAFIMQTAEKVYATYQLSATDPGGHSSVPRQDSAISRLARTLVALEEQHLPISLNETSRSYFARWAALAPPEERELLASLAAIEPGDPEPAGLADHAYYNSLARSTCVATMLAGGHAENALPQSATATVNCRIVPQQPAAEVEAWLSGLAAPNGVGVAATFPIAESPPSPLRNDVVEPVVRAAERYWPALPLIPEMSTGATDGAYLRRAGIPVYGVGAIAEDPADIRAHGRDERISVEAFGQALEFWYDLTVDIAR